MQWLYKEIQSELKLFAWTDFCFELGNRETVTCGVLQRMVVGLKSTSASMVL